MNMTQPAKTRKRRQRIRCDQCEMLSINGVACHETGCPNMGARWQANSTRDYDGYWVKQRECFECGCTVDFDDLCCAEEPAPWLDVEEDDGEDDEDYGVWSKRKREEARCR